MELPKHRISGVTTARNSFAVVVVVLTATILTGCGEKNWSYVTGVVTFEGQPVGPGSIMFESTDTSNPTATAAIAHFGEDGIYEVKSAGNRVGAPVGEYRVMIHGSDEETFGEERIDPTFKTKIPARYLDYGTTRLTAKFELGENTIDFPLSN